MSAILVEMRDVNVVHRRGDRSSHTLKDISMTIAKGETVGLVGESGAGKSTIGNCLLGLAPVTTGSITLDGNSIRNLTARQQRDLTAEVQMVFQDPLGSLNPTLSIGSAVAEPLWAHGERNRAILRTKVAEKLAAVGVDPDAAGRMPGQFSGGQLQRIAIARALMLEPKLIILDEPVSALDLSVQAQVLNLLSDLQQQTGVSYLFVSHDMAVVKHVADRIVVLEAGAVVEQGDAEQVISAPSHPYTQRLLDAVLMPDPAVQRARRSLHNEV